MKSIEFINDQPKALILFDDACNLCNASVRFILRRDNKAHFYFVPQQSEHAKNILKKYGFQSSRPASLILIANEKIHVRSDAVLQIVKQLSRAWKLLYCLIIIPRFMRNSVYDFIAKKRYHWFGGKENCTVLNPAWKHRFFE